MNELKYPFLISILPPEEGGGYLIEFPDLPGCMSDGETIEETIENGKDAVFCWNGLPHDIKVYYDNPSCQLLIDIALRWSARI